MFFHADGHEPKHILIDTHLTFHFRNCRGRGIYVQVKIVCFAVFVDPVGGAAQTKIMKRKDTGGGVRLALAQYRELAAFAQFASDLDEATRKQLERGRMVTELMKQAQYQPLEVWEMALTLFAVNNDVFDDIDVNKALAAEKSMRDYIKGKYADLVKRIDETKNLNEDDEKALRDAIADWKANGTY